MEIVEEINWALQAGKHVYVEKPVSPKTSLIFLAGLFLSIVNALLIPLLMEYTHFQHLLPEFSLKEFGGRLAKTT